MSTQLTKSAHTECAVSVGLVRSRGSRLYFSGPIPSEQPQIANGFCLFAIAAFADHMEARDVSDASDYAELLAESRKTGAYFRIEALYSVVGIPKYYLN